MVRFRTTILEYVVGKESGLPIPVLDFSFGQAAWYEDPSFIEALAEKLPKPKPTYPANASPKQREQALVSILEQQSDKKSLCIWKSDLQRRLDRFWKCIGEEMRKKGAGVDILLKTKRRVRHFLDKQRDARWKQTYGLLRRGNVSANRGDCFFPFQSEVMRELPNPVLSFVPPVVQKNLRTPHVERLRDLEEQLKTVMRIRGGYVRDKRDSNDGFSLGKTTVTGGAHSDKNKGISGSVHASRTLTGMSQKKINECRKEGVDPNKLQEDILEVIAELIVDSFGTAPWFKAALHKLNTIPEERKLPKGRLPCSHIWWTSNPKAYHVHTDTNTVPPAFLICVSRCRGGELCCLPPTGGPTVIDTDTPTVVGGSWAQYPHCNLPVLDGERHSFVVYMDHRNLSESYKVVIV